ncbi:hypothetical protein Fmac_023889 [Flemingia macrophylla]|uniref:Uncharacterized protein n=1 Tax=Flemingia macrophylla TaxID=520843 RepID=A0ABD1LMZ2_9FABA
MANSRYSKSCKTIFLSILFTYFLFVGSCTAARTMATMEQNESSEFLKPKQYKGFVFNILPKGQEAPSGPSRKGHHSKPIFHILPKGQETYSGPSKRHDSVAPPSGPSNLVDPKRNN